MAAALIDYIVKTPVLYQHLKRIDRQMSRRYLKGEYDREQGIEEFRSVVDRGAKAYASAMRVGRVFDEDTLDLTACEFEMNFVLYYMEP